MTEAQAAWLRKLRDEGPTDASYRGLGKAPYFCRIKGFSAWATNAHEYRDFREWITPAGLAALAEHEEKGK